MGFCTATDCEYFLHLTCPSGVGAVSYFVGGADSTGTLPGACVQSSGYATYKIGRSLNSDDFANGGASLTVQARYLCVDSGGSHYEYGAITVDAVDNTCTCPGLTGKDIQSSVDGLAGGGTIIRSRSLGCTDCTASATLSFDAPTELVRNPPGAPVCFCASGGTSVDGGAPTYHFQIMEGHLPGGQSLNPDTGCVQGTADPAIAGSPIITIRVIDVLSGEYADAECALGMPDCTGKGKTNTMNYFL